MIEIPIVKYDSRKKNEIHWNYLYEKPLFLLLSEAFDIFLLMQGCGKEENRECIDRVCSVCYDIMSTKWVVA